MSAAKEVRRRTFEAVKYPKESAERERLNRSALTSEYMPSYRYVVIDGAVTTTFRTKREADVFAGKKNA